MEVEMDGEDLIKNKIATWVNKIQEWHTTNINTKQNNGGTDWLIESKDIFHKESPEGILVKPC